MESRIDDIEYLNGLIRGSAELVGLVIVDPTITSLREQINGSNIREYRDLTSVILDEFLKDLSKGYMKL